MSRIRASTVVALSEEVYSGDVTIAGSMTAPPALEQRAQDPVADIVQCGPSRANSERTDLRRTSQRRSRKLLILLVLTRLAPRAGFEPATLRLTAGCSTVELPRNRERGTLVLKGRRGRRQENPKFNGFPDTHATVPLAASAFLVHFCSTFVPVMCRRRCLDERFELDVTFLAT